MSDSLSKASRRKGRGVRGGSWPPNSGRYMTFIRAKDNTFVWLTVSPRMEQVSILPHLRYISGGVTKETFIGYSLRPSKTGTAIVHYYFFSLAGPRDKHVVFAIQAKLGLTPKWMFARTPMIESARVRIPLCYSFKTLASSFSLWCPSSISYINCYRQCWECEWIVSVRNCSGTRMLPWCRNEQVCQGVKCKALWSVQWTGCSQHTCSIVKWFDSSLSNLSPWNWL